HSWSVLFLNVNLDIFFLVCSNSTSSQGHHVGKTEVDWMYLWDFLPVFNWAFHIIEFIPVERNPNCIKSQEYAAEHGLPVLKNWTA
ncbi:hypothetical protein ACJX0J_029586, partial [Zea mays]